jgi:hypothetical protein
MPYNRNHVRSLLNASELALFESSLPGAVKDLSERRLRSALGRARTLRDKFRDLLQRQKIATRGRTGSKLGNSGVANQRTERKATVMAEVLARFEARAAELDTATKKAATKKAATKAGATKQAATKQAATKKAATKKAATNKTATKQATTKQATTKKGATTKQATAKKAAAKTGAPKGAPAARRKAKAGAEGRPATEVLREALRKKNQRAASGAARQPLDRPLSDKAPARPPTGSNAAVEPSAGRKAPRIWESGLQRIEGHIGTQVRRAQGKRDNRG